MKYILSFLMILVLGTVTLASTPDVVGETVETVMPSDLEVEGVSITTLEEQGEINFSGVVSFDDGVCCVEYEFQEGHLMMRLTWDDGHTGEWIPSAPNKWAECD